MKDEKKAYRRGSSCGSSQRHLKLDARSKTKDDNMRSFFVNMPSYKEYANKSNISKKSKQSKYEQNCSCKDVLLVD